MQYLEIEDYIRNADIVITAEGSLDGQTPFGKVPADVARRAKQSGVPVVALAGTIGKGVRLNLDCGIDALASILARPCSLEDAISSAPKLLARAAEDAVRMIMIGANLRLPMARAS
jgi:glycerate kinase